MDFRRKQAPSTMVNTRRMSERLAQIKLEASPAPQWIPPTAPQLTFGVTPPISSANTTYPDPMAATNPFAQFLKPKSSFPKSSSSEAEGEDMSSSGDVPSSSEEGSSDSEQNMTQSRLEYALPSRQEKTKLPQHKAPPLFFRPKLSEKEDEARLLTTHLSLLGAQGGTHQDHHEVKGAPVFTSQVLSHHKSLFAQYGFFAGLSSMMDVTAPSSKPQDPRLFFNISAPSSAFICGSQGSGKSHTLSCLLENCLMKSDLSKLENPLAGLVFHYDSFSSDFCGTPCEAAYLSSDPKIKVRVLCAPTNIATTKRTYGGLNVTIEPLHINQSDLNTKRMLDLMAVSSDNGPMPLYLHAVNRILRELRIQQQVTGASFNYRKFKDMVEDCDMTPAQLAPLTQRLDTLESFMPRSQTARTKQKAMMSVAKGNDWSIKAGTLTIVDLSCPCMTSEGACALFNMCLSLYLEQKTTIGRVIALDEAHKYMNTSTEASTLTQTLLSSIRLQRHLGTRIFVSTQEPTISPALLDLCSITIVHRFTSPEWMKCLRQHLAALDHDHLELDLDADTKAVKTTRQKEVFAKIVKLKVGEALLFAPSAMVGIKTRDDASDPVSGAAKESTEEFRIARLGTGYLKMKIRGRLTADGGASIMAN